MYADDTEIYFASKPDCPKELENNLNSDLFKISEYLDNFSCIQTKNKYDIEQWTREMTTCLGTKQWSGLAAVDFGVECVIA